MLAWLNFSTPLTHFGDLTITLLVASIIAVWLVVEDEKRLAASWTLLFGLGMGVVVLTKIAFIGWGIGIRSIDFAGFSGHAMRAAAVYPVLMYLLFERTRAGARAGAIAAGGVFALLIGHSRLALGVHTVSEVMAGLALGALVSATFIWLAAHMLRKEVFNPLRVVLMSLALLPAPYVHPAPTQQWLTKLTLYLSGSEQPVVRAEWHHPRARR
jgi:membrane-associated phospholipid phosphatase